MKINTLVLNSAALEYLTLQLGRNVGAGSDQAARQVAPVGFLRGGLGQTRQQRESAAVDPGVTAPHSRTRPLAAPHNSKQKKRKKKERKFQAV